MMSPREETYVIKSLAVSMFDPDKSALGKELTDQDLKTQDSSSDGT